MFQLSAESLCCMKLYLKLVSSKLLAHGVVAPKHQDNGSLRCITLCRVQQQVDSVLYCGGLFWWNSHPRMSKPGHGNFTIDLRPAGQIINGSGVGDRLFVTESVHAWYESSKI